MGGTNEPLDPPEARRRIRDILDTGTVTPSRHALDEMEQDDMTMVDCVNVLRGGFPEPPDFERGSWRYRVRTARMCVVIGFRSEREIVIVTAWRERQ